MLSDEEEIERLQGDFAEDEVYGELWHNIKQVRELRAEIDRLRAENARLQAELDRKTSPAGDKINSPTTPESPPRA